VLLNKEADRNLLHSVMSYTQVSIE